MQRKPRLVVLAVATAFASASAFAAGDKQRQTMSEEQRNPAAASQQHSQAQPGERQSQHSQMKAGERQHSQAQAGERQQHAGTAQNQESVKQAQEKLADLGYDVGPVDGIVGPKTQAALREFQQAKGLQATGQLNSQTLAALEQGGGGAAAAGPSGPRGQSGEAGSSASRPMGQERAPHAPDAEKKTR